MNIPEELTLDWLVKHAEQRLVGAERRWEISMWNRVAYLSFSQGWSPEQVGEYAGYLAGMPGLVRAGQEKTFVVFEMTLMELRETELHLYAPANWLKLLDQKNLSVCLVDGSPNRRDHWHKLYTVIGKRYRVHIFGTPDEALAWVHSELTTPSGPLTPRTPGTERIGDFLVNAGAMTRRQVDYVVGMQIAGDSRRFGEIALALGFVRDDAIKRYVDYLERQPERG